MSVSSLDEMQRERKRVMDLLALATLPELSLAWDEIAEKPAILSVRGPQTGLVMVRGKTGGSGQPFNLGEVAVSRATIMVQDGPAGHAHILGHQPEKARLAAVFDGLAQMPEYRSAVSHLLGRVSKRVSEDRRKQAEETAATRVDFFTMVRGED
jgi:alpha-D-ribose 1-methylphosphonate 5-triphosphate synthase subunit PhnG